MIKTIETKVAACVLAVALAAGEGYVSRVTFWSETPSMRRLPAWPWLVSVGLRLGGAGAPDATMRVMALELARRGARVLWVEGSGMRTPSLGQRRDRGRLPRITGRGRVGVSAARAARGARAGADGARLSVAMGVEERVRMGAGDVLVAAGADAAARRVRHPARAGPYAGVLVPGVAPARLADDARDPRARHGGAPGVSGQVRVRSAPGPVAPH
jgi:hypothetical protein